MAYVRSRDHVADIGPATWANRPAVSANGRFYCTDVGDGVLMESDGNVWYPLNHSPIVLTSGVPFGLVSSATIGDNGALSSATAFGTTYESCYLYFPADAIETGSTAGFYYVVMSSTTAGTIYNNTWDGTSIPAAPSTPTAFATTGPGAFTQATTEITALNYPIQAGFMGANGLYDIWINESSNNSANDKTIKTYLGASALDTSLVTTGTASIAVRGSNRNNAAKQTFAVFADAASTLVRTAIDTSAATAIKVSFTLETATDNVMVEGFSIGLLPA